jgi:hypothetical protein
MRFLLLFFPLSILYVGAISNFYENLRIFANEYFSRVSTTLVINEKNKISSDFVETLLECSLYSQDYFSPNVHFNV